MLKSIKLWIKNSAYYVLHTYIQSKVGLQMNILLERWLFYIYNCFYPDIKYLENIPNYVSSATGIDFKIIRKY